MDRPTEECFGGWITEKRQEVYSFRSHVTDDFWMVSADEAKVAAYDMVDLVFLNDEYCHFRKTFWNVKSYCKSEDSMCGPTDMMENM